MHWFTFLGPIGLIWLLTRGGGGGQAWGGWAREAGKGGRWGGGTREQWEQQGGGQGVGAGGSRELGGDIWSGGWTARKRGGASLATPGYA